MGVDKLKRMIKDNRKTKGKRPYISSCHRRLFVINSKKRLTNKKTRYSKCIRGKVTILLLPYIRKQDLRKGINLLNWTCY